MRPTWVLERNIFSERCFEAMLAHFSANGIPHHVVRIIPFVHTVEGETPKIDGPVICYGPLGVAKLAAAQGWRPGVWTSDSFSETAVQSARMLRYARFFAPRTSEKQLSYTGGTRFAKRSVRSWAKANDRQARFRPYGGHEG